MRILIHWQDFPEYGAACVRALRQLYSPETLVVYDRLNRNTHYDRPRYTGVGSLQDISGMGQRELGKLVTAFNPDAALVGGWTRYARTIARASKGAGAVTVAMSDVIPKATPRQRLFPWFRRIILDSIVDYFWVPGTMARDYLVNAGISNNRIYDGAYSIELERFRNAKEIRSRGGWPEALLFVGQYVERKGIAELVEAFTSLGEDWTLLMAGDGPLRDFVDEAASRHPRIRNLGFVTQERIPEVMASAGALVLPSREEHWGVVALEASAAGLPLVVSRSCGVAADLIEKDRNGWIFDDGEPGALKESLSALFDSPESRLRDMGGTSARLAESYGSRQWADTLIQLAGKGQDRQSAVT